MAELATASPQLQLSGVQLGIKAEARQRWFELALVMLVAFSRSIVGSIHILMNGPALSLSFQFLVFAGFFAGLRRALPIVVAHGLFDIYALIRLL